jgi:putative ABC transport system permease protein
LSGRLPSAADEVLLEKHLAQHHGLREGDTVTVAIGSLARTLRVSGIAVSAEYLWVSRDENDVFPSPDAFGVGWMARDALADLSLAVLSVSPAAVAGLPGIGVAADARASDQILVDPAPGASDEDAKAAVLRVLGARVLGVTPAARLVGPRLLQMDVDGYKGMAAFFPVFFLGVAAFIVAAILGRIVDVQRALVGTFAALGVGRARVLAHYLAYAVVLGGFGSTLGALAGVLAAPGMTREYAAELGIPFVEATVHLDFVAWGIGIGLAVAVVSGFLPAWHASRLAPAEAMRPPRPTAGPLARLTRGLRAPLPLRLAVRDVLGKPVRSLGTALGVAAALVLVLCTSAMLDSMKTTFSVLFSDARRYDLRVDLVSPAPLVAVEARFAQVEGVVAVEGILSLPVTIRGAGPEAQAIAVGVAPEARLLRSMDLDGRDVAPADRGVVLTRALARSLGVSPGDAVRLRPLPEGPEASFVVSGLADGALGRTVTARREDLQRALGFAGRGDAVLVETEPGRSTAVRRALSRVPDVAHVEDAAALRTQVDAIMGLGWAMLGMMFASSIVLAAAILFNTATLGILERRRELATLRALGRTLREIGIALTLEHSILALLGLGMGFPLAIATAKKILALYSSELFALPFVLAPRTVAVSSLGIVAVLLVAQWPALHQLAKTSLADAVRTRET